MRYQVYKPLVEHYSAKFNFQGPDECNLANNNIDIVDKWLQEQDFHFNYDDSTADVYEIPQVI